MPLPIRDGNQSLTTLSTVITGGEHIPAHTVVSLGATAIANIASAVSGVPIAGTVTANDSGALTIVNSSTVTKQNVKFTALAGAYNPTDVAQSYTLSPINVDIKGISYVDGQYVDYRNTCVAQLVGQGGPAWKAQLIASSVTVSNSVTIGSLPAISGTVTASLSESLLYPDGATGLTKGLAVGFLENQSSFSPQFTIPNTDGTRPFPVAIVLNDGAEYANGVGNGDNSKFLPISGTVTVSNSVTIGSLPAISGTVTANVSTKSWFSSVAQNYLDTQFIAVGGWDNANLQIAPIPLTDGADRVIVQVDNPISGTVTANAQYFDASLDANYSNSAPIFLNESGDFRTVGFYDPLPISGTVTANAGNFGFDENQNLTVGGEKGILVGWYDDASGEYRRAGDATPLPISGTVTVGNSITIGSLPAISGTVTAQFPANSKRSLYVNSPGYAYFTGIYVAENQKLEVNRVSYKSTNSDASIDYRTDDNRWYLTTGGGTGVYKSTTTGSFEPIGLSWQQGEGANFPPYPTVTTFSEICVADAKISSLPAIRGTVTANTGLSQPLTDTQLRASAVPVSLASLPASTVTARLQDASGNNLTSTSIGGLQRLNVSLASAATPGGTLPSFVNVYGGSDSGTVRALAVDSSGRTVVTGTISGRVQGWDIATHDYRAFGYSGGNLATITYKTGGASGTTVGILSFAYDGSGNLTSMTRT